ncbi:MAG: HAMP domain-containing histidine kinase, partial [Gammaproteobacteria bacterium]|nr:HAMP domain-containing histidine kinase [Gammaproteobacteria bacterium]
TIFSGYRIFLAVMLFVAFYFRLPPEFLGESDPHLYSRTSQFYLLVAVVLMIFTSKQWGDFGLQTTIQLIIDIVVITLIIHASGGLKTGLGSLLVVVVVIGSAMIPGRIAAFIAAIATLSVLLEVGYSQISGDNVTKYSHAGMLGATFFATAILTQILAKKIHVSQNLAEQRAEDVAKLAMLNEHIISRMQMGVLVVESSGRIRMSNQSARTLLGISNVESGETLKQWVPELAQQLWLWKQHQSNAFRPFQAQADLPEVLAGAMSLDSGETVLYIENTSAMAQQAQQLKLASLGRLTASIAHEIRNPLGAISHAGELLEEIGNGDQNATKLTGMIQHHSARVNSIIETILHMSRRKTTEAAVVMLATWMEKFVDEFCEYKQIERNEINLHVTAPLAKVFIDSEQLHQVVWNLMENAWHFSDPLQALPRVEIKLSLQDNAVVIDVIDNGPGVSDSALQQLFEPFYSQRKGGTGLGLYLARELCQANGARLNYISSKQEPCCFRIHFPLMKKENLQ